MTSTRSRKLLHAVPFLLLLLLIFLSRSAFAQADSCEISLPFCTTDKYVFPAGTNTTAQSGPDYGCLYTQPNPAWYHMKIALAGDININMVSDPLRDIDFICWGPFTDAFAPCTDELTGSVIVDCSYAPWSIENCYIPDGQVDEYYILMITNYSNQPCDIIFQKTSGTGETDCTIVPPPVHNNGPLCAGDTLNLYADTVANTTYYWYGPNGFTSTQQNPVIPNVAVINAGNYFLEVTTLGSTSNPTHTSVAITALPDIDFTLDVNDTTCSDELITYTGTDISGTNITSWDWNFGDGNVASNQIVTHTYYIGGYYNTTLIAINDGNCSDTASMYIKVIDSVYVTAGSDDTICQNDPYDFSTSLILPDTNNCDSILWIGGMGNFNDPKLLRPVYYNGANETGQVLLSLIAFSPEPCGNDTSTMVLTVDSIPDGNFTYVPIDTCCVTELVAFDATSTCAITSWQWDFGDGIMGSGQNITHAYADGDSTYDISLTIINNYGCVDTIFDSIYVDSVNVGFDIFSTPTCLGDTVYFHGTGDTITYTDWNWDFGDGSGLAVGRDVSHAYSVPDQYNVKLMVCNDTTEHSITVNDTAYAHAGSNETLCESFPFDFATSSIPPIASSYDSLLWSSDGTGSFNDRKVLLPVYTPGVGEAGPVDFSLVAYGKWPCSDYTSFVTITYDTLPDPGYVQFPIDSICVDEMISFTDTSTTNVQGWQWIFGDGNTSSLQNPDHTYIAAGGYNLKLIVTNDEGCSDSIVSTIQIHPLPEPDFTILPNDTICAELPLSFNGFDNAGTTITNWDWDFGDGSSDTVQNVVHTYTAPGDYTITLNVLNNNSCTETIAKTVRVQGLPESNFTMSPNDTNCMGEQISFDATDISGDITLWNWQFGDGNTGTGQNVVHTYNGGLSANFNILSIFGNANGCLDTTIHQRNVQIVNIGFDMIESPSCQDYQVDFLGTGDLVTFTDWNWDFGDGSPPGLGHDTSHVYTQPDTVYVTLDVCSEQSVQQLIINATCLVDAGSDEATCENAYFNFGNSATPPTADGYDSVRWFTDGLGHFDDSTLIAPTYFPDSAEGAIQIDTVIMTMVGYGIPPCVNDTSQMMLLVVTGAYAQAGSDENSCFGKPYDFANSTEPAYAANYVVLYWSTSGTGYFVDPNVEQPVYVPGPGEIGPVTLTMVAANIINCDSIDEMVLTIRPEYAMPFDTTICFHDSLFAQGAWHFASGIFYDTLQSEYGCDSVIITHLTVRPKIDWDFIISTSDSICYGETVSFTSTGSANLVYWLWDFGDGNTSSGINPTHQYDTSGYFTVIYYYTDDNNCSDSATGQVRVFELPDVWFTIDMPNPCIDAELDFSGNSNFNITSWQWDFGDGQSGTGQNTSHVYTTWGNMAISLTVTDINGCSETAYQFIDIAQPPVADFAYNIIVCDSMQFTDLSTCAAGYTIVTWDWDFGDGTTDTLQNPTHHYPYSTTPGGVVYNVSLIIVTDSSGFTCTDSITLTVAVPELPDIFSTINLNPPCFGDTAYYFGGSNYEIDIWHWDFGDSYGSFDQNTSHLYANSGSYAIVLTITDTNGCMNTMDSVLMVNPLPDVWFSIDMPNPCVNAQLNFSGGSNFNITSWQWDFGDGQTGTGQNTSHVYTIWGNMAISLTVTDINGCSETAYQFIDIAEPPVADFTYNIIVCDSMQFTDLSTCAAGYTIVTWDWDFGDGTTGTLQNPTHHYPYSTTPSGVIYNVSLIIVTDSSGFTCSDSITLPVTVPELPDIFCTINPDPLCLGDTTYFFGGSNYVIDIWDWDFGDSYGSFDQNTSHLYADTGSYAIVLNITDTNGCVNTFDSILMVNPLPDVWFTMNTTFACVNTPVDFSGNSNFNIASWQWDFGDGQSGTGQNISHVYTSWGYMTVVLTVTDMIGCSETIYHFIEVAQTPTANFTYNSIICDSIQFIDLSTCAAGYNLVEWYWDFDDGSPIDTAQNPQHQYPPSTIPGGEIYNVILVVVADSSGFICTDSVTLPVIAPPLPDIFYTFVPEPTCLGDTTYFYGESGFFIDSWHWDFDDGNFSTDQYTNHLYSDTGSYTVILNIIDTLGCENTLSKTVTVGPVPDVSFTMSDSMMCHGSSISFFGSGSGNVTVWYWEFGDGSHSYLQNPSHYYTTSGTYTVSLTATDSTGCSNTATDEVLIFPNPTANYSFAPFTCSSLVFTDLSTAPPNYALVEWHWDFDDGFTSTVQNPSHTFPVGGVYDVMLITTADSVGNSCTDTTIQTVTVPGLPTVYFTWTPEPTMLGDATNFFGTSGSTIIDWYWDFGDGNSAITQDAAHVFAFIGTFDVELTVTDIDGCVNSVVHQVTVTHVPELDYHWDFACEGDTAQFFIDSPPTDIPAVTDWNWDFGDGETSTDMEPRHVYTTAATYNVSLTIMDTMGTTNTEVKPITINPLPTPLFGIEPPTCSGNEVQFHDHSTTVMGFITGWHWDFGDGNDTTVIFPGDPDVSHTYANADTYVAMLTVTNSDSCSNSTTNPIVISAAPTAIFTHSSGCASEPVSFTDMSMENGGGTIITWLWNFGDPASGSNNTSSLQNPIHLFSIDGDYDVLLTITNINDCGDTSTATVTIAEEPAVDFTWTDGCLGSETQFHVDTTVTNIGEVQSYAWDFGDGGTSSLPNPTHEYAVAGDFTVTLTITTTGGCIANTFHIVQINPLPNPNFDHTGPICLYDTVLFTDLSSSPNGLITTWHWDFGDGSDTTINAPGSPDVSHIYTNNAIFAATLTVTDSDSCENTVVKLIEVVPSPIADFTFVETCYEDPVIFTDLSITNGGTDLFTWEWDFGDPLSGIDNSSALQNPIHEYTKPGIYTTTLIITSTLGCTDTTEQDIIVDSLPYVEFTIGSDTICRGESVDFMGIGTNISIWFWDFGDGGHSFEQNPTYAYMASGTYTVILTVTEIGPDQCQNSASHEIFVNDAPEADFDYEHACLGDSTYFTDLSYSQNGFVTSWEWDFGDGGTSTEEDPVHCYSDNDNYEVTLVSTDNYGCTDTIIQWAQVFGIPNADFTFSQLCEPEGQINFLDKSEPGGDNSPITAWDWNIHDGNHSTETDPTYIFPQTDTCYTVILEITDGNGCISTDTNEQVCLHGTLAIEFTSTEVCFGQGTFFQASYCPARDSVASYTWNFNDGTPNEITYHDTIGHVFPHPGVFITELVALDTNGCSATYYGEVIIDSLPTPMFTNTIGNCDNSTQFTDESLGCGEFIESWQWDFGDVISGANNTSTDQHPIHLYGPYDSTYQVKLVVVNFNGCMDSTVQDVYVEPCLVAGFELLRDTTCARRCSGFIDTSYVSSDNGVIVHWYWSFGDGLVYDYDTYESPVKHFYSNPGHYQVQLVIEAIFNNVTYYDTIMRILTVRPRPRAYILLTNNCLGDTTCFFDISDDMGEPVISRYWDFGDLSVETDTSSVKDPNYLYQSYGNFSATLEVINRFSCKDTIAETVEIYKPPEAAFSFDETCKSYYTYFNNESIGDSSDIEHYHWDFGDTYTIADTSSLQDAAYIYDSTGYYTVHLTVIDGNICYDTIAHDIEIYPLPTSDFVIHDTVQQGLIYLDNISKDALSYYWDFNFDYEMSSTEKNPAHQYETDGSYNIMLVSYNEYGCPDTTYKIYDLLFTNLFVPNAFVPSNPNSELNVFKPVGINLKSYRLEIYSAWGNLVFHSTRLQDGAPAEGWDGNYEGKPMPTGSFIWRIYAVFEDGKHWKGTDNGDGNTGTSGTVTLIR